MNYMTAITTDESSRRYLKDKVDWLLDLLDKEHQHATTHSQRNHYQALMRIELQIMRDELDYTYVSGQGIVRLAELDGSVTVHLNADVAGMDDSTKEALGRTIGAAVEQIKHGWRPGINDWDYQQWVVYRDGAWAINQTAMNFETWMSDRFGGENVEGGR